MASEDLGSLVDSIIGTLRENNSSRFFELVEGIPSIFDRRYDITNVEHLARITPSWAAIVRFFGGLEHLSDEQRTTMISTLEEIKDGNTQPSLKIRYINADLFCQGAVDLAHRVAQSRSSDEEVFAKLKDFPNVFSRYAKAESSLQPLLEFYKTLAVPIIGNPRKAAYLVTTYPKVANFAEKVFYWGLSELRAQDFLAHETLFTRPKEKNGYDYLRDIGKLSLVVMAYMNGVKNLSRALDRTVDSLIAQAQGEIDRAIVMAHGLMVFSTTLHKEGFLNAQWTKYDPARVFLGYVLSVPEDFIYQQSETKKHLAHVVDYALTACHDSSGKNDFKNMYTQHIVKQMYELGGQTGRQEGISRNLLGRVSTLLEIGGYRVLQSDAIKRAQQELPDLFESIRNLATTDTPSAKKFCRLFSVRY